MARVTLDPDSLRDKITTLTPADLDAVQLALDAERNRLQAELDALAAAQALHRPNIAACNRTIGTCTMELDSGVRTERIRTRIEFEDTDDTIHVVELDADLADIGEIFTRPATQGELDHHQAILAGNA